MAITSLHNEKLIIKQVSEGDEHSFRQLFAHYADAIYTVALNYCKSHELSEEMVQDVFLKIWLKKETLSEVEKFDNYLFIVARNHILNVLRKKAKEPSFVEVLEAYFLKNEGLADDKVILKETEKFIQEAINHLPPQQQTVFRLGKIEGLSHQQIADKMNISPLTVKFHMQKALQGVRNYLKKQQPGLLLTVGLLLFIK